MYDTRNFLQILIFIHCHYKIFLYIHSIKSCKINIYKDVLETNKMMSQNDLSECT
jgi:hypothetical protein